MEWMCEFFKYFVDRFEHLNGRERKTHGNFLPGYWKNDEDV
jgi:hypothetical protein